MTTAIEIVRWIFIATLCIFCTICESEGDDCIDNMCYYVEHEYKTWYDAEQHCIDTGGNLAYYGSIPSDLQLEANESYWVRESQEPLQRTGWRWIHGEHVTWIENNDVEFDSSQIRRNCLVIKHTPSSQRWWKYPCGSNHNYICETEHGRNCRLTQKGSNFFGNLSLLNCQIWSEKATRLLDPVFPDGNITMARNYCRNPDGANEPYCFVPESCGQTIKFCSNITFCGMENRPSCFESTGVPESHVTCFDGKCYFAVTHASKSWLDAIDCCSSMGGALATFQNKTIADKVYADLREHLPNNLWVGAYDSDWDIENGNFACYSKHSEGISSQPCNSSRKFICEKERPPTTTTTTTTTSSTTAVPSPSAPSNVPGISTTSPSANIFASTRASNAVTNTNSITASSEGLQTSTLATLVNDSSIEKTADNGGDNNNLLYIGIGGGAGVLIIIMAVISVVLACRPKKEKKEAPFSMYSHRIYSAPIPQPGREPVYDESPVFEDNELYKSTDDAYDMRYGPSPMKNAKTESHYSEPNEVWRDTHTPNGLQNPVFNEEKQSVYAKPNRLSKDLKDKKPKFGEQHDANPHYDELPDLPPRGY